MLALLSFHDSSAKSSGVIQWKNALYVHWLFFAEFIALAKNLLTAALRFFELDLQCWQLSNLYYLRVVNGE